MADGDDLLLCDLSARPGALSPGFSPRRRHYALRLAHADRAIRVTAVCGRPEACVLVAGVPVAAGGTSAPLAVEPGPQQLAVEVRTADGSHRTLYTVTVTRGYAAPDWDLVTAEGPFAPRDSAGELVFDGQMWLIGGYLPELASDVWSSPDGVAWAPQAQVPAAEGINIPLTWVHGGRMWVTSNSGRLFASGDGRSWELVNPCPPWRGRYAAGGAVLDGRMWVLGGKDAAGLHNDVWSSRDGVDWVLETPAAPWSPRQLFSMVVAHAGRLWVLGGGVTVYHPFRAYTDVWCSGDGRRWVQVTDQAPWPARIWSSAASFCDRLWVLGGFRAEPTWNNFADTWYSADGTDWQQLPTEHLWSARHELSAYVHAGRLWVVAGNAWPLQRDVWSLSVEGLRFVTQPVVEEFATARYVYRARADFHASGRPLRYRLVAGPEWLRVDAVTGTVSGVPTAPGRHAVALEATDPAGQTARQDYVLQVIPVSSTGTPTTLRQDRTPGR